MPLILVLGQCQFQKGQPAACVNYKDGPFYPLHSLIGHPIYDLQFLSHEYCSLCSTPICAPVSPHGFGTPVGAGTDHHKNKRLTTAEMVSAANEKKETQHISLGAAII